MTHTIDVTTYIPQEQNITQKLFSTTMMAQEDNLPPAILALQRRNQPQDKKYTPFYQFIIDEFAGKTRNDEVQLNYLDAFEKAVSIFRTTALELRKTMGVLSLEQRVAALNQTTQDQPPQANEQNQEPTQQLQTKITDAIFFSNRYALCFAGYVGLGLLGIDKSPTENLFSFGKYDTSKERDDLTQRLARIVLNDLNRIVEAHKPQLDQQEEGKQCQDQYNQILKETLQSVFTSWINQFRIETHNNTTTEFNLADLILQYDHYSMKAGIGKKKHDLVIVDEKFMNERKEDVIGTQELGIRLWDNCLKLAAYDSDRKKNPYDPASVIFTYGEPGGGKTFTAHAYIQSFAELCRTKGISLWALTHSTTDYASHYQNKTANELSALAGKIKEFPGIVIMYVADADNIFQSRKDPRLTAEQQQILGVYFKMFDGTMIPKNGKFMAVMDANYLEGIDDATKSRLFDEIVEVKRFATASDFSELARRSLSRGLGTLGINQPDWDEIGTYLVDCPLSNREIQHVIKQLRRGFSITEEMITRTYDEHIQHRNTQLQSLTKETILTKFEGYISQRMQVERASYESRRQDDLTRFAKYLEIQSTGGSAGQ